MKMARTRTTIPRIPEDDTLGDTARTDTPLFRYRRRCCSPLGRSENRGQ